MLVVRLPNPKEYKHFTPPQRIITYTPSNYNLIKEIEKINSTTNKRIYKNTLIEYFSMVEMFGKKFIGELNYLHNKKLKKCESKHIKLQSYIHHYYQEYRGFCTHSSLVVEMYNDTGELKTLAIRRYKKKNGEVIKWYKLKGSDAKLIPYKLRDSYSFAFVAFGIAEAIIFNILDLDYFVLQSDSLAFTIENNPYFLAIKEKLKDRQILILPDYDTSGLSAANALAVKLKPFSNPRIIEFYKLVDNPSKGFDFRDYVKLIQDEERIVLNLVKLLKGDNR